MKIAIFEIEGWEKQYLQEKLSNHQVTFFENTIQEENLSSVLDAEAIVVFIYSQVTTELIKKFPKLKIITTRSTGYDHIDLKEAQKRNITVCNVPFYGENTVAEHTFGLILSLSRNIHTSYQRTLKHDFSIEGLMGFDLEGKTIGVIGTGHIGLHVIKIAQGFGMNILAYDVYHNNFMAEFLHYQYVELEKLLSTSDIITLHAPYNKHTHHLINEKNIQKIKKGAFLINTARGGLVQTSALLKALDENILAGAGLDVIEGEELMMDEKRLLNDQKNHQKMQTVLQDHMILDRERVVYTPHLAFYSKEALERILQSTIENITHGLSNTPHNQVQLQKK